ncbi:serine protease [Devosia sp.]|uniref:trypsin-like serine peptidase n=1 Tax=Devosia sp. TaxID=1871048 RepID=UPI0035B08005
MLKRRAAVRTILLGVATLALCLDAVAVGAAEPCGSTESGMFGDWRPIAGFKTSRLQSSGRTFLEVADDTRYVRLFVERPAQAGSGWSLTIRDRDGRVMQVLGPNDFGESNVTFSRRLANAEGQQTIELELAAIGERPKLLLRQKIEMPESGVIGEPYYSRRGDYPWSALYAADVNYRSWGDDVAFIMVGLVEGQAPSTCSGLAIPPDLLLTNWHCGPVYGLDRKPIVERQWEQAICDRTTIDLSWDDDGISREFICDRVLSSDQQRDYALLRIRPLDGISTIAPVSFGPPVSDGKVTIVHHPAAMKKQISIECDVLQQMRDKDGIAGIAFGHACDTEKGSSGAPVFDAAGNVVGLHYSGFEVASGLCDRVNKALWIGPILQHIEDQIAATPERFTVPEVREIAAAASGAS